ncbi:MAG: cell wall-binding repeat-containing protein, partial [Terrimesophilobacter sp.]
TARLGASSVTRFGGSNRFAVATAVNRDAFTTTDTFFVSSGFVFPDALSATPAAVSVGAPLYVTNTSCVDRAFVQHMIDAGATKLVIVGGPGSVSGSAAAFKNC